MFFEGLNKLAACPAGQTICEAAEKAGITLDADCHQGVCGMDPVKVIAGVEFLTPVAAPSDQRSKICARSSPVRIGSPAWRACRGRSKSRS